MSDWQVQAIVRRWRSTGDPAERARLLAAEYRAGRLARHRLMAAAYLGDAQALELLKDDPIGHRLRAWSFGRWATGLAGFGPALALRAAFTAAQLALRVWSASRPSDQRPAEALAVAAQCFDRCTSEDHRLARECAVAAAVAASALRDEEGPGDAVEAGFAAHFCARCVIAPTGRNVMNCLESAADAVGSEEHVRHALTGLVDLVMFDGDLVVYRCGGTRSR